MLKAGRLMRKTLLALALLGGAVMVTAEDGYRHPLFRPPFDFPLLLSGNFGELRSNHFHGGIDFKTQGVEGKPIHGIADGYISRVSVAPGGYGNAIYITHENGYTSVYGHLKAFSPEVAEVIRAHQYAHETFAVDTTFAPGRFPVRRGEVVALAGNSGYSFGPHLHMEIRETATNEPIDPLIFYKDKIKDTTPPRAKGIMLYPQAGRGVVEGGTGKRPFAFGKGRRVEQEIRAWGSIGAGISANDYMDGTTNNYGVHTVTLLVDGREVFRSVVDRFAFEENRMINAWTDYAEYVRRGKWYMKSFVAPGNPLRMLHTPEGGRGIVTIDEERPYHFTYRLADLYGNTAEYGFTVQGVPQEIPAGGASGSICLQHGRDNFVFEEGVRLHVPRGRLYEDVCMDIRVSDPADTLAPSYIFQLGEEPVPLHDYCTLSVPFRHWPTVETAKYYVAARRGKWQGSVGGTYERGMMTAQIRELGASYWIAIDSVAPRVTPVTSPDEWTRTETITLKIADDETGIAAYKGRIDGAFVLFAYSSKTRRLTCRLADTPVEATGGLHMLELTVEDACGNITGYKQVFRY